MSALFEQVQGIGQLTARNPFEVLALCLKVNAEPHPREVKERGNGGRLDDINVRHTDELRHEERSSPHDGRHELSAGGRRRLDGARKVRVVAELFHHGDGE